MNVFVIHSYSDKEEVKALVSSIKKECYKFNPLMLGDGGVLWKIDAESKIKKSQLVLLLK